MDTPPMNILMMTNTYAPTVGGVARSVQAFAEEYRSRGHQVLVVAPDFDGAPERETGVVRIPAIERFNDSDFSVVLPVSNHLKTAVEAFAPDLIHSHHPFLIGSTAIRLAHRHQCPLVFTHHTMYEQYTHYVPGNRKALARFVISLSTSYANLCDMVFAPSQSVAALLAERGVEAPIRVVPTGIEPAAFARGNGPGFRAALGIPRRAFVVGHVGRLAPEKNLSFLAEAVAAFLSANPQACFLLLGKGPSESVIQETFERAGLTGRLYRTGLIEQPLLASAYRAMDVFAFASKSETQGMVLAEAMAAGVPVVALDAAGVREIVTDRRNGRLIAGDGLEDFVDALRWVAALSPGQIRGLGRTATATIDRFSIERTAGQALSHYARLTDPDGPARRIGDHDTAWASIQRRIGVEWTVFKSVAGAAGAMIGSRTVGLRASAGPDRGNGVDDAGKLRG